MTSRKTLLQGLLCLVLVVSFIAPALVDGATPATAEVIDGALEGHTSQASAGVAWDCPLGGVALVAPNPGAGRPSLDVPVACADITASAGAQLWGIYYLIETGPDAGTWLWYILGFATSTLTQLEPGKLYWVVVSAPCILTTTPGASETIGPEGGTIEVTDPSNRLYGVKVDIPEGALTESTVIEIHEESNPPPLSPEIVPVSAVIRLSPDGIRFNSPVKIRLRYNTESVETGDLVVPLIYSIYSKADDYWYVPYIVDIDQNEGMVEIETTHFSHLTIAIIDCGHPPTYDTKFRPQVNGFPTDFKNTGGWCQGMACFCQWLYENHPECNGISTISEADAQQIAEAAQSLTDPGGLFQRMKTGYRGTFTWHEFLCVAEHEMSKSGLPTVIARWATGEEGKQHALLAYRYDGDAIWYYDVNHPGQELQLTAAEYDQAGIDYAVVHPTELYSPTHFEELFDKYKDVLCPGENWCFTFYNRLPAVYLYIDPVEIYYVDEDYGPVTPVEMDIDFNEIPELAEFAQLWYVPVPEKPICIEVTREGDNIDASFEFTHEPTGYDVSAELSGMIIDNAVYFNINYYPPKGLRNYSMELNYSDCMSDMEGTVYYSLPAVLTANYQGTIVGGTIQGAFQAVVAGQWARWRYHDQEYGCRVVGDLLVREELLFDGLVEWRLSNLRLSGDFLVDIGY